MVCVFVWFTVLGALQGCMGLARPLPTVSRISWHQHQKGLTGCGKTQGLGGHELLKVCNALETSSIQAAGRPGTSTVRPVCSWRQNLWRQRPNPMSYLHCAEPLTCPANVCILMFSARCRTSALPPPIPALFLQVLCHEMQHNYGLQHAAQQNSNWVTNQYGDISCIM